MVHGLKAEKKNMHKGGEVTKVALARYARDTKITENNFFALRALPAQLNAQPV